MLKGVTEDSSYRLKQGPVLMLDTCGERASVALAGLDGALWAEEVLPARAASSLLLAAIRSLFGREGVRDAHSLAAVGVVGGPGSFTGVRVGLAVAKGLVEAAALPMAVVSRLAVLATLGNHSDLCVVSAGRHEVYVRISGENGPSERLLSDEALKAVQPGCPVIVDSEVLAARLLAGDAERRSMFHPMTAASAVPLVLRQLAQGGCDPCLVDANYVRDESTIYRRSPE